MIKELNISLFDLINSLSNAMDLVSRAVAGHQKRVAYIAMSIGAEMGLALEQQKELVLAGALHDSGALSQKERLDLMQFDLENPYEHAELGYALLQKFEPLSNIAFIVRYHHLPWDDGRGRESNDNKVPIGSHLLHLADRIDILSDKKKEILGQVKDICSKIKEFKGKMFVPEMVDAFMSLSVKEYFWLDIASTSIDSILANRIRLATIELDIENLINLTKIFSHIIDFRSRFTATHSSGVTASAEALARLLGFSSRECKMMRIAGHLHDLGKLAVPTEILEKPAKLTKEEFNVVRCHTFHTYRSLEPIKDIEVINGWASFHHERLDGSGYPFHHHGQDLSLGAQVMAVADVFTAITEDRPYRKGMRSDRALQIMQQLGDSSVLSPHIVSQLKLHFDEINSLRINAQSTSREEYQLFHPH